MKVRRASGNQLLITENLRITQPDERVPEQVRVTAVVVPPIQFVEVGGKMLHRHVMVRTDNGTFEQRPDAFDGVGVDFLVLWCPEERARDHFDG